MSATVMIVVTHLLGTGHLARALTLGRAFAAAGHDVHVVSGGFPVPQLDNTGVRLHQLPPLRANGTDFAMLLGAEGQPFGPAEHANRLSVLLRLLEEITPDILLTELFPFGRRNLRDEFLALLGAVDARAKVFCSIRDVLAPPSKPAKATFAEQTILAHYDGILVHSDPVVLPLSRSWPVTDTLEPRLIYTGFVAPSPPAAHSGPRDGAIIVSAGGGTVGAALFDAAVIAARNSVYRWHLLVGTNTDDARLADLTKRGGENVLVERARPDFRALLTRARASVSFSGYNTTMDILQTGVPAVIVPFDEGNETEQTVRAEALRGLRGFDILSASDLTPEALLAALSRVTEAAPRDVSDIRFDGAHETVRICVESVR